MKKATTPIYSRVLTNPNHASAFGAPLKRSLAAASATTDSIKNRSEDSTVYTTTSTVSSDIKRTRVDEYDDQEAYAADYSSESDDEDDESVATFIDETLENIAQPNVEDFLNNQPPAVHVDLVNNNGFSTPEHPQVNQQARAVPPIALAFNAYAQPTLPQAEIAVRTARKLSYQSE